MSFGDTLCEVSGNTMFEEMVWEKMKPELIHIAGDRHAKGCNVRFIGVGESFSKNIADVILGDGISNYDYFYPDDSEWHYGVIYWEKSSYYGRYVEDLSDNVLEVFINSDGVIQIEKVNLAKDNKQKGYTYIS